MKQTSSFPQVEGPRAARPAFVSYLPGGQQNFPNDPVLDAARTRALKAAGLIKFRRIPAAKVA